MWRSVVPLVTLKPEAAQAMAMVLHELTTNAAKHGALSHPSGRVRLRWWWLRNGSSGWLAIEWQEKGGPSVRGPAPNGLRHQCYQGAYSVRAQRQR